MAAESTTPDDDVLARFSSKAAETDDEVKALLGALLAKFSSMEDSKWPTIVREFNQRAAVERNKQWIKRTAEKVKKTSPAPATDVSKASVASNGGYSAETCSEQLLKIDPIFVANSPIHGWGVFASRKVQKGETVHLTPFRHLDLTTACAPAGIIKPDLEGVAIFQKVLPKEIHTDLFAGRTEMERLLVLGLGSFFNHEDDPSVGYKFDHEAGTCRFFALRDVNEGEELLISYGKSYFAERGMDKA